MAFYGTSPDRAVTQPFYDIAPSTSTTFPYPSASGGYPSESSFESSIHSAYVSPVAQSVDWARRPEDLQTTPFSQTPAVTTSYQAWGAAAHPCHNGDAYVNASSYAQPQPYPSTHININTTISYSATAIPPVSNQTLPYASHPSTSPSSDQSASSFAAPSKVAGSAAVTEYQPQTKYASSLSYEERHKISDKVLKRWVQGQQPLPPVEFSYSPSPHEEQQITPPQQVPNDRSAPGHITSAALYAFQPAQFPPGASSFGSRTNVPSTHNSHSQVVVPHRHNVAISALRGAVPAVPSAKPRHQQPHYDPTPVETRPPNAIVQGSSIGDRGSLGLSKPTKLPTDALPTSPQRLPASAGLHDTIPTSLQSPPDQLAGTIGYGGPVPPSNSLRGVRGQGRGKRKSKSTTPNYTNTFVQFSPYQNDREKQEIRRVDTSRLKSQSSPAPEIKFSASPEPPSSITPPSVPPMHQTITLEDCSEEMSADAASPEGKCAADKKAAKKPFLACQFCRVRKIACGPGPTLPPEIILPPGPRTCNQCYRRGLICRFPEASRRGLRLGKPSRRVIYGPDNQFKIVDPDDLEDGEYEWEQVEAYEQDLCDGKKGKKKSKAGGNSKYPPRPWSPICFIPAVDSHILRDLAARGVIPPGGYT
ncbi:hypothetical protein FRB99_002895 [Tulasnella sp. 403]|nr:hypothetical protein FRB99_002895 [Tulasnella sp. 403]